MAVNVGQVAKAVVKVGLVFSVAAGMFWAVTHRQTILDWWQLRSYTPSAEVKAIADDTTMVGVGRDVFYVSDPEIQDKETFNQSCHDVGEEGSVLGCYVGQRIYLYNVNDPKLPKVKEVTAAHEMLHAVYERHDPTDRKRIDQLVQQAADKLKDDVELKDVMKLYAKTEPGQLSNELHSILGTEYDNLPAELETYYKQYFSNRAKVVSYAKNYKAVFAASKARIADYDAQLDELKGKIDDAENDLQARRAELDSESARLQSLRNSDTNAYNQAVPGYNAKVRAFNTKARDYNAMIAQFNDIVAKRNQEAAAQNDLYHSLDSQYQPL